MNYLTFALQDHAHDDHGHAHAQHTDLMPLTTTPGQSAMPALTALLVFGVLLLVLWLKVWPKITAGLDEREKKIRDEIRGAEEARRQAELAKQEFERQLAQARQDSAALIAKAKEDAQAVANDLRSRNEADLNDMKQRAKRDIDAARAQAVAEIHAHASNLATTMAGKILKREINVTDQQRLLDESVQELAASKS
jgi:F-type H+-transporting ATPase subunit b